MACFWPSMKSNSCLISFLSSACSFLNFLRNSSILSSPDTDTNDVIPVPHIWRWLRLNRVQGRSLRVRLEHSESFHATAYIAPSLPPLIKLHVKVFVRLVQVLQLDIEPRPQG